MIWKLKECNPGDIIRVKLGSVYHYGIFVSDEEVIQFGYPPINEYADKEKVVISTNINIFACEQFVEVGSLTFHDHMKRFKPEYTIKMARERLGQGGYDVIENNCEHFAFECYTGKHYSSQTSDNKKKWSRFKK